MKKLIYIPIVHNKADLGSLGSQLSQEGERKYGVSEWQNHIGQVEKSWDNIETELFKRLRKTSFAHVKIYQDGLPVTGDIGMKIVRDAALAGSKNYSIIEKLIIRGANLEIAENKELLLKEYYLLSDINKAETPEKQMAAYLAYQNSSGELIISRDNFVANQINTTLKHGETGIAFFGATHCILDKLNADIKVTVIQLFTDVISSNLIK